MKAKVHSYKLLTLFYYFRISDVDHRWISQVSQFSSRVSLSLSALNLKADCFICQLEGNATRWRT